MDASTRRSGLISSVLAGFVILIAAGGCGRAAWSYYVPGGFNTLEPSRIDLMPDPSATESPTRPLPSVEQQRPPAEDAVDDAAKDPERHPSIWRRKLRAAYAMAGYGPRLA